MKKISFILFFVIFGCAKPEVDLRIVDAADIFDQVATHVGQDVVLVNFWATHCSPCIEEMPYILELEQEYKDCLLYTSPSPRDRTRSRMPSSA